jgi:hypothetical protein
MMPKPGAVIAALLLAAGALTAQGSGEVPRLPSLPPAGSEARIPGAETGSEEAGDVEPGGWEYRSPEGELARLPLELPAGKGSPGPPGALSQTLTVVLILGAVLASLFLWYARALRRQQER